MEKLIISGLVMWFALMSWETPSTIKHDRKPTPAVPTVNLQKSGNQQDNAAIPFSETVKPIRTREHVELYHSPD